MVISAQQHTASFEIQIQTIICESNLFVALRDSKEETIWAMKRKYDSSNDNACGCKQVDSI
jgi:hypothetical protein